MAKVQSYRVAVSDVQDIKSIERDLRDHQHLVVVAAEKVRQALKRLNAEDKHLAEAQYSEKQFVKEYAPRIAEGSFEVSSKIKKDAVWFTKKQLSDEQTPASDEDVLTDKQLNIELKRLYLRFTRAWRARNDANGAYGRAQERLREAIRDSDFYQVAYDGYRSDPAAATHA